VAPDQQLPGVDPAAPQQAGPQDGYAQAQQPYEQQQYAQQPYEQPASYAQQPYPGQPYGQQPYPQQPYPGQPYGWEDPNAKSRLAAGLLGIFLGALGIHRFYLGHTGLGLTMLLISVLSLGTLAWAVGIWGLIEGILYLTAKQGSYSVDSQGRPLRS
jgi:TM2 domain-containing membrane protein YozV